VSQVIQIWAFERALLKKVIDFAEILVDVVDVVLQGSGIDEKFLGITLFALVPNTTEFMNAFSFALNGNIALRSVILPGFPQMKMKHWLTRSRCNYIVQYGDRVSVRSPSLFAADPGHGRLLSIL
jgi:hypothetical protein